MSLFEDDFEVKKTLVDMLDKVTYGQALAISVALGKWEELEKLKKETEFTRQYIRDSGLEWDLLSCFERHERSNNNAED